MLRCTRRSFKNYHSVAALNKQLKISTIRRSLPHLTAATCATTGRTFARATLNLCLQSSRMAHSAVLLATSAYMAPRYLPAFHSQRKRSRTSATMPRTMLGHSTATGKKIATQSGSLVCCRCRVKPAMWCVLRTRATTRTAFSSHTGKRSARTARCHSGPLIHASVQTTTRRR